MITDLTEYIVDWVLAWPDLSGDCILSEDPGVDWDDGLHLAYKDGEKGVILKSSDEFEYSGIDDRRGNFIYLRHLDDEKLTHNPIPQKVSSCIQSVQVTANLRLVSVIRNVAVATGLERYEIEEFIRNALLNINWDAYAGDERSPSIELLQSLINSPQILDEERGPKDEKRSRGFGKENIFTAIDFVLRFNYHGEPKGNIGASV